MPKRGLIVAFVLSAALAAGIWGLSLPLAGSREPWDAAGPYYLIALAATGALSGAIVPKHLGAHYAGAVIGQAAYELAFLKLGALFVLGLGFLAVYTLVFLAAVALAASFRAPAEEQRGPGAP